MYNNTERREREKARVKSLTPEQKQAEKDRKAEESKWRKIDRENAKEQKLKDKTKKFERKRELSILQFMAKTDVFNNHHGCKDSMLDKITNRISRIKSGGDYTEYDPYGWNWGVGRPGLSLLGCRWSMREFDSIYDVPLDGSYIFYVYDSGDRGCGSKDRMSATKVEDEIKVPYVNPGAILPITSN